MFDKQIRRLIDPAIETLAKLIAERGVSANSITFAGFAIGAFAAIAISFDCFYLGLALLLASRLADGLDGAVARISGKTDFGGFIDIVADFAFYGMIPLAFVFSDPTNNAVAGAVLIFSFYVNGASFLTFALMAERRGVDPLSLGSKSLLYTVGLAEATETIVVFILFCLFPDLFVPIALFFALICMITAAVRVVMAARAFAP